jgi:uncharacterized protein (TIGR03086 family)
VGIIELHARAVRASVAVVQLADIGDFNRPTPCAEWTLADLLEHMVAQHRGFAGAARGAVTEPEQWKPIPLGAFAVSAYVDAADDVLAAFAEDGVLERSFSLPEFSTNRLFPGTVAVEAHFIDYVVHGWDVARSLGQPYELDDEVIAEATRLAEAIPAGDRRRPFFVDPAPGPAQGLEHVVAHLGRSPNWPS